MLGIDFNNLDYKKILIGVGIIVFAIIIAVLIYWVFFRTPPVEEPTEVTEEPGITGGLRPADEGTGQVGVDVDPATGLPIGVGLPASEIAQGGVTVTNSLTDTSSEFVTWAADGQNLVYYSNQANQFFRVDANGQAQALTNKKFYDVSNVVWADAQDKAILEYPDGSKIVYNFNTGKQVSLPKHWEQFDFSPNGNQIVGKSLGLDPDNRWLIVTNDDGSQAKKIEPLGNNEDIVTVGWSPNNQVIATYTKGVDFDRQNLFFIGLNNENFKKTTIEGRGFQGQWAPQGDRLLYSVYNSRTDLNPELWVVDAQGESIGNNRRDLKIPTWANKCTFASDTTLYCGVPETLEEGSGLFPQLANTTTDHIYKIDLRTGSTEMIAQPAGDYSIRQLLVSQDQRYLFFNDAKTGQIFKIRLK